MNNIVTFAVIACCILLPYNLSAEEYSTRVLVTATEEATLSSELAAKVESIPIDEGSKFKDEVYLGIRPEDISIKSNHDIQLNVKVDLVENLGFEKIIYTKLSENQIIIKSSEDISNQLLNISFSKEKVLFFDKNKNRIR